MVVVVLMHAGTAMLLLECLLVLLGYGGCRGRQGCLRRELGLLLLLVVLGSGRRSCCQGRLLVLLLERRMGRLLRRRQVRVLIGLVFDGRWRWCFPLIILKTIGVVVAEDPPGQLARPQGIGSFRFGLYQRRHGCLLLLLLLQLETTVDGRRTATRVLPAGPVRCTTLAVSLFFPWLIF